MIFALGSSTSCGAHGTVGDMSAATQRVNSRSRRHILQSAVRLLLVVLLSPRADIPPRLKQKCKPVLVQTLFPQLPVKTLHIRVLHPTPQFDVHQVNFPFQPHARKCRLAESGARSDSLDISSA